MKVSKLVTWTEKVVVLVGPTSVPLDEQKCQFRLNSRENLEKYLPAGFCLMYEHYTPLD